MREFINKVYGRQMNMFDVVFINLFLVDLMSIKNIPWWLLFLVFMGSIIMVIIEDDANDQ